MILSRAAVRLFACVYGFASYAFVALPVDVALHAAHSVASSTACNSVMATVWCIFRTEPEYALVCPMHTFQNCEGHTFNQQASGPVASGSS